MSVMTYDQSTANWVQHQPDGFHNALIDDNPLFWAAIPFWEALDLEWRSLPYMLEADVLTTSVVNGPSLFNPPPITVAALPVLPFATYATGRKGQFRLTNKDLPYAEVHQPEVKGLENNRMQNLSLKVEEFGRNLLIDIIRRGAVMPTQSIGSIHATLASYSNTPTAVITQGFSAAALAQQTTTAVGRLFQYDTVAGTVTVSSVEPLRRALAAVKQATAIIMPQRAYSAMMQSYVNGPRVMPMIAPQEAFSNLQVQPQRVPARIPTFDGVPIVVVPDDHYTAAGHTVTGAVGAADYDIYIIRSGIGYNDRGCGVAFARQARLVQAQMETSGGMPNAPTFPIGGGMFTLTKQAMISTAAGVIPASAFLLNFYGNFTCGAPDSLYILQGVTD